MAKHIESGKFGEALAERFLRDKGYQIISVNWRYRYWEVDILAKDKDILVFVEVKSRKRSDFGYPADFVDEKKQRNLIQAAEAYIELVNYDGEIRFDIISVFLDTGKVEIIKDAFWSN